MSVFETYMLRCLELAALGSGFVAPNPMVGAVLVYEDQVLGEGYHKKYGEAHAEVNCINSVQGDKKHLIASSTLYVSLEPCSHFGKTPPCADLIIQHRIPKVVIGCLDPFAAVNGRGIKKLQEAGIDAVSGVLEKKCLDLNKRFITFHQLHRPYIILKWAETGNKKIAGVGPSRLFISHVLTNRLVHKWRSEEASIMAGTNTAFLDDPLLTNRLWKGNNPIRIIIDKELRLPSSSRVFNDHAKTIIFNTIKHEENNHVLYYQITHDVNLVHQVIHALYQMNIQSVIVEGGARLIQSFIEESLWDEARVITNEHLIVKEGLAAPELTNASFLEQEKFGTDVVRYYLGK